MRVYYIFDIKSEFVSLYLNNANTLFNILKQIYLMNGEDIQYGFSLFRQIVNKIPKEDLDKTLFLKFHRNFCYCKKDGVHIINQLYLDEVSRLEIKRSHILLNTNRNYSSFFEILSNYQLNYFVCDFINQDYFWLSQIKTLV